MKLIKWFVIAVVLLIVIGIFILYASLDGIIKSQVQTRATDSLNLTTTLGSADLSLLGGSLSLNDLNVASPSGFSAPQMLSLGSAGLSVNYSQLRGNPIHVKSITLDKPVLTLEQKNGEMNFQAAMDQMPKSEPSSSNTNEASPSTSTKLVIDQLTVTNAQVVVDPGQIPGLSGVMPSSMTVPLPPITLNNIGNADGAANGAAIKDVVMQVVTAMVNQASKSGNLPGQLQSILQSSVASMATKLGGPYAQQIGAIIANPGAALKNPGALLQSIPGVTSQPAVKNLEQNFGNLLGGDKKSQ